MLDLAGTEAAGALSLLLLGDGDKVDLEVVELKGVKVRLMMWDHQVKMDSTYAQVLEQVLGVSIDIELAGLGLGDIQSRDLRNVLILALTLLLLKLEGDTADGTTLDTLHQVSGVTGDLVAQALGGNDGDLIANALVGLEVQGELRVVTLNDNLG